MTTQVLCLQEFLFSFFRRLLCSALQALISVINTISRGSPESLVNFGIAFPIMDFPTKLAS